MSPANEIGKGGVMKVIRATTLGMCFGVRDALEVADAVERPSRVTIHGELLHNPIVLDRLHARGFQEVAETNRGSGAEFNLALYPTEQILITAHGISDRARQAFQSAGKMLIDTTCPLVKRVHQAAQRLEQDGFHVLVIGSPAHVEVLGIVEDLSCFQIVTDVSDVTRLPMRRIGVVCQSTTDPDRAARILDAIRENNPHAEVRFVDTICQPTRDRQMALERLLEQIDALVVVGGRNSNNTRALVMRGRARGIPAFHVESAGEIDASWFEGFTTIGLTAGTSTLDETIEQVYQALLRLPGATAAPM